MNKQDRVRAVYDTLPPIACKGLCRSWCSGGIATNSVEKRVLGDRGVHLLPLAEGDSKRPCPALTILGRCGVYEDRPLICRLAGAVENMPCPHGCEPEGGLLTRQQGGEVVLAMVAVAGEAE